MRTLVIALCTCLLFSGLALADPVVTFKFDSPEQEALFHKLSNELRCLVCQNQSIGDSNAGLAKDLRTEMYEMLQAGKTEDEIIDFMVNRYGDFVLYNPPFKPVTLLLWFGPMLVFAIGVFFALRFIRAQKQEVVDNEISAAEIERLRELQAQGRDLK